MTPPRSKLGREKATLAKRAVSGAAKPRSRTAAGAKAQPPLAAQRYSWRKLSAAKWGDSWLERLAFLGPGRAMLIEFPNAPKVRVEGHGLTRKEADDLVKMFGGQVSESKWLTAVDPPLRPPIRIREKLLIVSTQRERDDAAARGERRGVVWIPAGMAFGTGEHDTTVTCLRLLADRCAELPRDSWEHLDLGTGSGILALAGRRLGARRAEAGDFDPHAVRTAKENVRTNAVKGVRVRRMDVRQWQPERTWEVVTANLFSGLLIEVAPKIAAAVAPGGALIFSGVLREQETEVAAAFQGCGLEIVRIVRKGKWIAGLASQP